MFITLNLLREVQCANRVCPELCVEGTHTKMANPIDTEIEEMMNNIVKEWYSNKRNCPFFCTHTFTHTHTNKYVSFFVVFFCFFTSFSDYYYFYYYYYYYYY